MKIWRYGKKHEFFAKKFSNYIKKVNFIEILSSKISLMLPLGLLWTILLKVFQEGGNIEFINFLIIAKGSAGESKSQLYRAYDRNYIDEIKFSEMKLMIEDIYNKFNNFILYLEKSDFIEPTRRKDL